MRYTTMPVAAVAAVVGATAFGDHHRGGTRRSRGLVSDWRRGETKLRLTFAAVAFVCAMWGAAVLGDDHGGGASVDCSQYPWWCQGYCAELNLCRAGNTPIGGTDCGIEENNLESCKVSPPPFVVPPVGPIIIIPPRTSTRM